MTIEPQPQPQIADQPQPFADQPGDPPGGCSRPLMIGCALVVVLLGLLLLGLLWKADDLIPGLFRWSLDQLETQVMSNLPDDLSEAERQRLEAAFESAATAVEEGNADPAELQRLQGVLVEVVQAGKLSRRQLEELTSALERVAGERASPVAEPPPPAVERAPQPVAV